MPNSKGMAAPPTPDDETIARRAYELYLQRGSLPGFELDDWLQAEAELVARTSASRTATPTRATRQAAAAPPANVRDR